MAVQWTNTKESWFEAAFTNHLVDNWFVQKFYFWENAANKWDYDPVLCMDTNSLWEFIENTQPEEVEKLKNNYWDKYKERFQERLSGEIEKFWIIKVLRKWVEDRDASIKLMYFKPTSILNEETIKLWESNIFIVTRQLYFSPTNDKSIDMVILINWLPIITMELKNLITNQDANDAMWQYKTNRDPREPLLRFKRCVVHLAVDTEIVFMTTKLEGPKTKFLPFNKWYDFWAWNPPVEDWIRISYMWENILTKESLSRILESFVQLVIEEKKDWRKIEKLIFPRYHQLDVVNKLLEDAKNNWVWQRYLIEHSAWSWKSNSISWLAYQLIWLYKNDWKTNVFDTVLVVTDRKVLDSQLRDTVIWFDHKKDMVETIVEWAKQLKQALEEWKKIITTTIHKFWVIANAIWKLKSKNFAIIIDEAHSSTSWELMSKMGKTIQLQDDEDEEEITSEDIILQALESRKLLDNASYFAFTATPKSKTLELFWTKTDEWKFVPFHLYSMKQAIEEWFIVDVLTNYTSYQSYYKLKLEANEDEEVSKIKANKQLKRYVEWHEAPILKKATEMITHFYENVYLKWLLWWRAKAMVVCSSRKNAVKYCLAFKKIIAERNYPLWVIAAFSGDINFDWNKFNESNLNWFSSAMIKDEFETDRYQILICANKFQTWFDQPLLQTMYVDKPLWWVNAVQTLSRLNRSYDGKDSVFILDFVNSVEDIKNAFQPYYTTTILSEWTDPNKLNDLISEMETFNILPTEDIIHDFAVKIIKWMSVDEMHGIMDKTVEEVKKLENEKIDEFKIKSKAYVKLYWFLSQIITFSKPKFEELYVFLKILSKKITALWTTNDDPIWQDVLNSVDLDSYKNNKITSNARISLSEDDWWELNPTNEKWWVVADEKDLLKNIVSNFNDRFWTNFSSEDRVIIILETISNDIVNDSKMIESLQNTDKLNRKLEFQKILSDKLVATVEDNLELYNHFFENPDFQERLIQNLDKLVNKKLKDMI